MDDPKKDGCCSSEKSGCGCGRSGCGCRKIICAIVLLAVGAVLGYLCGGHCARKGMCPMSGNAMMMAPVTPPVK